MYGLPTPPQSEDLSVTTASAAAATRAGLRHGHPLKGRFVIGWQPFGLVGWPVLSIMPPLGYLDSDPIYRRRGRRRRRRRRRGDFDPMANVAAAQGLVLTAFHTGIILRLWSDSAGCIRSGARACRAFGRLCIHFVCRVPDVAVDGDHQSSLASPLHRGAGQRDCDGGHCDDEEPREMTNLQPLGVARIRHFVGA